MVLNGSESLGNQMVSQGWDRGTESVGPRCTSSWGAFDPTWVERGPPVRAAGSGPDGQHAPPVPMPHRGGSRPRFPRRTAAGRAPGRARGPTPILPLGDVRLVDEPAEDPPPRAASLAVDLVGNASSDRPWTIRRSRSATPDSWEARRSCRDALAGRFERRGSEFGPRARPGVARRASFSLFSQEHTHASQGPHRFVARPRGL